MRAYKLLKSGFQPWVTLFNSIHYKVMPIRLEDRVRLLVDYFSFRIDFEIKKTLRRFFRDKDLQKSSNRKSKVSDSQKTSEKYLEVSPWEFRESFRRFDWFENLIEEDQNFGIHINLQIQCTDLFLYFSIKIAKRCIHF